MSKNNLSNNVEDVVDEVPAAKKLKPLGEKNIRLREAAGNVWRIITEPATSREALLEPSLYGVIAHKLRAYDELIVLSAERTYYARLLVLQAGLGYCELMELNFVQLPAMLASVGETLPSNHRLVHDVSTGWSAIRISDGVPIIRGCDSQAECLRQLLAHASLTK